MNALRSAIVRTSLLGVAATSIASPAPSPEDVVRRLNDRQKRLSQLEVCFNTLAYQFPDDRAPFDESNWIPLASTVKGACFDFVGTVQLLAPDSFSLDLQEDCSSAGSQHSRYSWHAGELRVLGGVEIGRPSGAITSEHVLALLNTEHVLTPLGFRVFELKESLPEFLANAELGVSIEPGAPRLTRIRAVRSPGGYMQEVYVTIDPDRDDLATAIEFRWHLPGGVGTMACQVLESRIIADMWLPTRAAYYVHNPQVLAVYSLRDWRLHSAKRDASISPETIVVTFPKGTRAMHLVDRERWTVGPDGERLGLAKMPPAAEASAALRAGIEGARRAQQLRDARRAWVPYVISGAVLVTVVVVFLQWRWRIAVGG